jgi:hypothetical protein
MSFVLGMVAVWVLLGAPGLVSVWVSPVVLGRVLTGVLLVVKVVWVMG